MEKREKRTIFILWARSKQIFLMHDPYSVAWKLKSKQKLVADIVGHMPKKLLKVAWLFFECRWKINEKVFKEKYWLFPIYKGESEITLSTKLRIQTKGETLLVKYFLQLLNQWSCCDKFSKRKFWRIAIRWSRRRSLTDDEEENFIFLVWNVL